MGEKPHITPKRGDIFLVNFDPTIGREIQKTRPALVIQNDIWNRYSPITIVAALTTAVEGKVYPTEVLLKVSEGGLDRDSLVLLNQVRSIDTERLLKKLGKLTERRMKEVDVALALSLGLIDVS